MYYAEGLRECTEGFRDYTEASENALRASEISLRFFSVADEGRKTKDELLAQVSLLSRFRWTTVQRV